MVFVPFVVPTYLCGMNKKKSKFNQRPKLNHRPKPARPESELPMRLNKYVAHCGVCARRQAAEHVKGGKIKVNGEVEKNPSYFVKEGDVVEFNGKQIKLEERKVYILMNKPKNTITTLSDDRGRKTVIELVGDEVTERIFPVGRLDRMTTGLLLLTNDGDLAKKLSHPSHEVTKVYKVELDKAVSKNHLEEIRQGLKLEDGLAPVDWVEFSEADKKIVTIEIHIGRNRIVRRIFEHLGYEVIRLDRIFYAGLTKKDIPRGKYRHLTEPEVVKLKHFD